MGIMEIEKRGEFIYHPCISVVLYMKICQINCIYGIGSTGKLTRDIHLSLLIQGFDSIVIAPLKNRFTNDQGVFVVSNKLIAYTSAILKRCLGMQFDWAHIQTLRIIRILRREKPDVVHLQCINGNNINIYMLLRYLAKNKIKTLYTLHAEFPYTGGCGNTMDCERWRTGCGHCPNLKAGTQSPLIDGTHRTWEKQKKIYTLFETDNLHFTAVSPWLLSQANQARMIDRFDKSVVMNGVDTDIFRYETPNGEWRKKIGLSEDEKILLYVTASFYPHEDNLKGGKFILELAQRLKPTNVRIVVAANYGDGSNLPKNVSYIGRTSSQKELASLYCEANLTIITSKNETFGMPVAESLCCGTPVVGFKAGGPESIALSYYSEFVDYGDVDALEQAVLRWIDYPKDGKLIAKTAESHYSKEMMAYNYIEQYKKLNPCI